MMDKEICICGHNKFTHEDKYSSWMDLVGTMQIRVHLSQCNTEVCSCTKFIESKQSRTERSKRKND